MNRVFVGRVEQGMIWYLCQAGMLAKMLKLCGSNTALQSEASKVGSLPQSLRPALPPSRYPD